MYLLYVGMGIKNNMHLLNVPKSACLLNSSIYNLYVDGQNKQVMENMEYAQTSRRKGKKEIDHSAFINRQVCSFCRAQ